MQWKNQFFNAVGANKSIAMRNITNELFVTNKLEIISSKIKSFSEKNSVEEKTENGCKKYMIE